MHKEQALKIIEEALNGASLKGVYSLADSAMILQALSILKQDENNISI